MVYKALQTMTPALEGVTVNPSNRPAPGITPGGRLSTGSFIFMPVRGIINSALI
jgi:hypothetical protein